MIDMRSILGMHAHVNLRREPSMRAPWRSGRSLRSRRCLTVRAPCITSPGSGLKYQWRGQPWDSMQALDEATKQQLFPILHRMAGAESLMDLLEVLNQARSTISGQAQLSHPLQLTPLLLSTCLNRLAEYHLTEPELYQQAIASNSNEAEQLAFLEQQVVGVCEHHVAAGEVPDAYHVPTSKMASILWALATLKDAAQPGLPRTADASPCTTSQVVDAVGRWAAGSTHVSRPDFQAATTQDLTSLLWAFASLVAHARGHTNMLLVCQGRSVQTSNHNLSTLCKPDDVHQEACESVLVGACDELTARLKALEGGTQPCAASDLADIAWALAATGIRNLSTARLAEAVAHEVYRQISNRYSYNTPLTPHEVVKLVRAYACLGMQDVVISRMLDAVAGYVVKRIKERHVAAITRPSHFSALLNAYADLKHNSVVISELVSSSVRQMLQETASEHATCAWLNDDTERQVRWRTFLPASQVLHLLQGYQRLGFYPGQALVTSLLIPLTYQVQGSDSATLAGLLQVMSHMRFTPGHSYLQSALSHIHGLWQGGNATAQDLATGFIAAALLNHTPPAQVIHDVCSACLYLDNPDDVDDVAVTLQPKVTPGTHLTQPVTPETACQLLFGLVVAEAVDVRRLGMACVALRHDARRARQLPDAQLVCVAGAALVLGEEGREMMEEVLPEDINNKCWAALEGYLHNCSSSTRHDCDSIPQGWQETRINSQAVGAVSLQRAALSSSHVSQEALSLLPTQAASQQDAWEHLEGLGAQGRSSTSPVHVVLDVLDQTTDTAANNPTTALGVATFRAKVLECALTCDGFVRVVQWPVSAGGGR